MEKKTFANFAVNVTLTADAVARAYGSEGKELLSVKAKMAGDKDSFVNVAIFGEEAVAAGKAFVAGQRVRVLVSGASGKPYDKDGKSYASVDLTGGYIAECKEDDEEGFRIVGNLVADPKVVSGESGEFESGRILVHVGGEKAEPVAIEYTSAVSGCKKGDLVALTGTSLYATSFDKKDGTKGAAIKVSRAEIKHLTKAENDGEQAAA